MVLLDERAGMAGNVADRGSRHPVGVSEAVQASPAEDTVDRRAGISPSGLPGGPGHSVAGRGPR